MFRGCHLKIRLPEGPSCVKIVQCLLERHHDDYAFPGSSSISVDKLVDRSPETLTNSTFFDSDGNQAPVELLSQCVCAECRKASPRQVGELQ